MEEVLLLIEGYNLVNFLLVFFFLSKMDDIAQ